MKKRSETMSLLIKLLFRNGDRDKEQKKSARLEKEMAAYGFSKEEKELVRSGEYDPWDFDEEEMDEDSYYSDDT